MGNLTEKLDLSLLYVEDDEDIRESIISLLERRIAKVYSARDGLEGLKLFEQVHPDIIVTDIKMPEMDGLKMSQKIKEISPDTQIIIMSAFSDLDYLIQAINSGINQYILKPMDFGKLFTAIQKASYVVNLKKENERQKLELLEAKTRAETATKLKDRFVKLVAHDLKSPFLGILQFMDLLSTYPSLQNEPD
jgi:YesN/AraC family two-component response regulator